METKTLTRGDLVRYIPYTKDPKDRRKRVSRAIFSYFDKDGIEYRKSFTAPHWTPESNFYHLAPSTLETPKDL
jgi:hypothetical protein